MCVIISRQPGVEIPYTKIDSACHVNSDGWGYTMIDGKGLSETRKFYDPKGTDPDDVMKVLEEYKDKQIYLHLRFMTKGTKDVDNCQPFQISYKDKHGINSFFMHNGTLYDFDDKVGGRSDSHVFAHSYLAPMYQTFLRGSEAEIQMHDPVLLMIMKSISKTSTFLLYDTDGNELRVNDGKQFDGWWASNEYSFNRSHRTPDTKAYRYQSTYQGWDAKKDTSVIPFEPSNLSSKVIETGSKSTTEPTATTSTTNTKMKIQSLTKDQSGAIGTAINKYKSIKDRHVISHTPPIKRYTFADLANLEGLHDVMQLSEDEIEDIVLECPEAATLLIMDLLYELYEAKFQEAVNKRNGTTQN